jgi:hypothetical protein
VIHPDDGIRDSDAFLIDRLSGRGASVTSVRAADADPVAMEPQFELVVLPHGVIPASFESSWTMTRLPVVFSESELLRSMVRLSVVRGFASFDAVQVEPDASHPLTDGLPAWGLRYAERMMRFGVPVGALAPGARAVVTELRPELGRTGNRPIVVAEPGVEDLDGRILGARVAYVAAEDVRELSGYGRLLFDRAVTWAATGEVSVYATFVRGDADDDGDVELSDAIRLLDYLFRRGDPLSCEDAADANDDGRVGVTDAVVILKRLYDGGALPPPFPVPGVDPTPDRLVCPPRP